MEAWKDAVEAWTVAVNIHREYGNPKDLGYHSRLNEYIRSERLRETGAH
jgi:hypothetical protein